MHIYNISILLSLFVFYKLKTQGYVLTDTRTS
jgi:hypothetical protein